jgi:hypothetical protein
MADVHAVQQNGSLVGFVKAGDEVGERGLAAAAGADQGNGLARGRLEIDAAQHRLGAAGIGEPHVRSARRSAGP